MSKPGKMPKQYPFRGGVLTVNDAAKMFYISSHAVRNRLSKCGNDMEKAVMYFESRYGCGGVMPI